MMSCERTVAFVFALCASLCWADGLMISDVRVKAEAALEGLGVNAPTYHQLREGWEDFGITSNADFIALRQCMSTNWTDAIRNLSEISTNRCVRLVVIASMAEGGVTNFLSRVDEMTNLVISNRVDMGEFRFFRQRCYDVDPDAASVLVREYQDPAISNLIMKIFRAGGFPSGVNSIFDGTSKTLYEDMSADGLTGH